MVGFEVPGDSLDRSGYQIEDFELEENDDRWPHIESFLTERGICVAATLPPEKAEEKTNEIATKLARSGINANVELLCDD